MTGLRVIGGQCRGRKLASLPGFSIRPTSGLVRESIFNIIGSGIEGTVVLDLFAGTGAFGIEALSRGAERAVFVDNSRKALAVTRKNIEACGFQEKTETRCRDATRNLSGLGVKPMAFDLVFMDPPYNRGDAIKALRALKQSESVLNNDALIIVEHAAAEALNGVDPEFITSGERKYGATVVSFLLYRPGTTF